MYYRYKAKKKNKKRYKQLFLILVFSGIILLGYRYSQYLLFWKYTFNNLHNKVCEIENISDPRVRRERLSKLYKICKEYKGEKQVSSDAFLLSGKVSFNLGKTYFPGTFTDIIINENWENIGIRAKKEFIRCVKDIRKGISLRKDNNIGIEYILMLAKAYFYTDYRDIKAIYEIINKIEDVAALKSLSDIRFFAIINIMSMNENYGFEFLHKYGKSFDNLKGCLFLAIAYKIAKRYTSSIMEYKNILEKVSDDEIVKVVHKNLGEIYYRQTLYKESLFHYKNAYKIDRDNNLLKIGIGKNYYAMGYKSKALAIWNEVLMSDSSNMEIRGLLAQ